MRIRGPVSEPTPDPLSALDGRGPGGGSADLGVDSDVNLGVHAADGMADHGSDDPADPVADELAECADADAWDDLDGTQPSATAPIAGLRLAAADEAQLTEWIARIVERDQQALAELYDATARRVHALVQRVVRQPALADEVVEDTFFQVWRQAVRFDPARGRALTWVLGMARCRAIDALRREGRFRHASLDDGHQPEPSDSVPGADDLLEAARGHAELHRAMLRLNAQPRQLVALAFFRGMSHEEIASETALPLGTVKSQIRRALTTLRQLLGDTGAPAMVR